MKEGLDKLTEEERLILGMFTPSEKEIIKITGGDEKMMKFIERLKGLKYNYERMARFYVVVDARKEGKEIGLIMGRKEGRENNQIEMAKSMLEDGFKPEVVQKYTKLSIDKIMNLL